MRSDSVSEFTFLNHLRSQNAIIPTYSTYIIAMQKDTRLISVLIIKFEMRLVAEIGSLN